MTTAARALLGLAFASSLLACDTGSPSKPTPGRDEEKRGGTPESAPDGPCAKDDDCTLSCQSRGSCCSALAGCGCSHAALKAPAKAIASYNRERCDDDDYAECPTFNCATPDYERIDPKCEAGKCVAVKVMKSKP